MTTYTTIQGYIDQNITPGLGDITLTDEQALEVAQEMTEWIEGSVSGYSYTPGGLVERDDRNFWDVVADVLGDK